MLICTLDGDNIINREMLHDTLAASLPLPEWYGRNLDALYDCLLDIREETEIQLIHKEALKNHLGYYANVFQKAVSDACLENPGIHFKTYN